MKDEGALQEADETLYWMELLEESGKVKAERLVLLKLECNELIAIMTTIVVKVKKRIGKKS